MANSNDEIKPYTFLTPLIAGAATGFAVEVTLYPLDTLKTRLQSQQGFRQTGGFSGVYRGLTAVLAGTIPTTALFFASYELTKHTIQPHVSHHYAPLVNMLAACVGEVLACVFRVPMEIAKQRKQIYTGVAARRGTFRILVEAYKAEGIRRGLYRGFFSTVARDLPFSFIEMPIWELLKSTFKERNDGQINSFQSALCGSVAGAIASAITTPLDLAKTRIMLAEDYAVTRKLRVRPVLHSIYSEAGVRGLFAGLTPRVTAFTLGGFVFFGAYEYARSVCEIFIENR